MKEINNLLIPLNEIFMTVGGQFVVIEILFIEGIGIGMLLFGVFLSLPLYYMIHDTNKYISS